MSIPVRIVEQGVDWPAMIQAVGSVFAIGVAIVLPIIAGMIRKRELQRTVLTYARMIRDSVRALAIYNGVEPVVSDKYGLQISEIELKLPLVLESARALSIEGIRSADALNAFTRLIGAAITFNQALADNLAGNINSMVEGVNGLTPRRAAYERVCARYDELQSLLAPKPSLFRG